MKVAVLVKHVPVLVEIDRDKLRVNRAHEGMLNPFDAYAVDEAVRLKEQEVANDVTLVSLGPELAIPSLRRALAMGADRAILISDDAAVGSDLVATSYVLARVLERESPDLVLCGQQTSDSNGAVIWAAVAERLRRPLISQVSHLRIGDGMARGKRQTESGYEVIEVPLPAVVGLSDSVNEPRFPSLAGMIAARKKRVEVLSLRDIGVDNHRAGAHGSKTTVEAIRPQIERREARRIEDSETAADQIVTFLRERGVL